MKEPSLQSNKELFIVHFDDQQLFRDGVRITVEKERPFFKIHPLNEYYSGLNYISECLEKNVEIDVVISDFNHPGPNGYEFALEAKRIAKTYGKELPVILLSMSNLENPKIVKGLEEEVFNKHLTKEANSDEIIKTIESLCNIDTQEIPVIDEEKGHVVQKKSNLIWLRWIGILPASVACYFLAYALVKLIDLLRGKYDEGSDSFVHLFIPAIASGMAAYYFVFVGTHLAPFYKKIVAQILMIIVVLISGMGAFLLIAYQFKWDLLLETLGQIAGAVVAFNQSKELENEDAVIG